MVECKLFEGQVFPCTHETEGKCVSCPLAWLRVEDEHPLSPGIIVGNSVKHEGDDLVVTDTYLVKGDQKVDYTQSVRSGVYEINSVRRP